MSERERTADDHPGGPLSRAERILLSHLKNRFFEARTVLVEARKLIGAVPGSQKIEDRVQEALTAVDRLLESLKTRKQGAPAVAKPPAGPQELELLCMIPSSQKGSGR